MTDTPHTLFSPELVTVINAAYERAAERLDLRMTHSDRRAQLAKLIMDAAKAGETDETKLCDAAVAGVEREEAIRAKAHAIWEGEGHPNGRHEDHWTRARHDVEGARHSRDRAGDSRTV